MGVSKRDKREDHGEENIKEITTEIFQNDNELNKKTYLENCIMKFQNIRDKKKTQRLPW